MKFLVFLAVFTLLFSYTLAEGHDHHHNKNGLKIDLYTESYCPDCVRFILKSLAHAIKADGIFEMADINIYPYGNAYERPGHRYEWIFTCQHGPSECYGNQLENCAKYYYPKHAFFRWLVCFEEKIENDVALNDGTKDCAEQYGLDYEDVINCANDQSGLELTHASAAKTEHLRPPHTHTPWVTVNGMHSIAAEKAIIHNMLGYICENTQGERSLDCPQWRCSRYFGLL